MTACPSHNSKIHTRRRLDPREHIGIWLQPCTWKYETPGLTEVEFADSLPGLVVDSLPWTKSSDVYPCQLTVNRTDVTQCIIDDSECRIEELNVKNYQKITTRSDNIVIIVGSFSSSFAALSNISNISWFIRLCYCN